MHAAAAEINSTCYCCSDGKINITITGGATPFTYAWNNGATTQNIAGLTAGTYAVTVTDAGNCTATASAIITQPASPNAGSDQTI